MDAFIGEIRLLPYSYTPVGWLLCDGREIHIQQQQALFAVIGYAFGGQINLTFKLPDLRGLVVPGVGNDPSDLFDPAYGAKGGQVSVALTATNLPPHNHNFVAATAAQLKRSPSPAGNYLTGAYYSSNGTGNFENAKAFSPPVAGTASASMNPATVSPYPGLGNAHENRQPYLAVGFFINFDGLYPQRN